MSINVISETPYFPKGHGVHTAFLNQVEMLKSVHQKVLINSSKKADITHIHTLGPYSLYKLKRNHPAVITAHLVPESLVRSLRLGRFGKILTTKYLRYIYNSAELVLAVGDEVKNELIKIGVKKPIEVFPNPLNTSHFYADGSLRSKGRALLKLSDADKVALGVGQVQSRKGVEDFITVARSLPEITFIWVGGTPFKALTDQGKLPALFKDLPPNIQFPGGFSYDMMPAIYNASDVLFFPSYQETQGMVILEAGATQKPVLIRDLPEYKAIYKTGYLKASSNEIFINTLKKLFSDKDFYKTSSDEAYKLSQNFSFSALSQKLLSYYKSLL